MATQPSHLLLRPWRGGFGLAQSTPGVFLADRFSLLGDVSQQRRNARSVTRSGLNREEEIGRLSFLLRFGDRSGEFTRCCKLIRPSWVSVFPRQALHFPGVILHRTMPEC